jgi:hypothetical protein
MKLLLGAAVAALLIASPAMAQTDPAPTAAPTQCGTVEAAPTGAPDGATATREQVEAFTTRFNAWGEATRVALECKRTRAEAARAQADAWTLEFNNENGAARTAIAAWQAEVDEFNARAPARQNRGRSARSITD